MAVCNWVTEDYFSDLLRKGQRTHTALEKMVDDIHLDKEHTLANFLCHSGSEDFLWGLVLLLGDDNPRVAGNSAYIIGTVAESDLGCYRVLSLTKTCPSQKILRDLTKMLTFNDIESVMNAAGTMGTLAESTEGRIWMLGEACFDETVEQITMLLSNKNLWTASNAALVIARLSISEEGCTKLIAHHQSSHILSMLVASLGIDEAGRGMNAAFAIGRICDLDSGRKRLLTLPESEKMICSLARMLGCGELGASKNACFALSCLAASAEGHARLLSNMLSGDILRQLSTLLSASDSETAWFSAMTLRTLAAQPNGCVRLRESPQAIAALRAVELSDGLNDDLREEVKLTLDILRRLERPTAPTVQVLGPTSALISWEAVTSKSGLHVTYQLCENGRSVYRGVETTHTALGLRPHQTYQYRVRVVTEGDETDYSDGVMVQTEEDVPSEPVNLHLSAVTATQLKITWECPEVMNGEFRGYYVYLGDTQTDYTQDTTAIISGLSPSTAYTIQVCAATSRGKGERAEIEGCTAELGAHCPSTPTVSVLGRNEVHVVWKIPEVPLGRITRYEVLANGKIIYSGTALSYTERKLTADTEYTFVVSALTNEGRFDSKTTKRRTAKDEYDVPRSPLYQPPVVKKEDEGKITAEQKRRKSTSNIETKISNQIRISSACSHKKDETNRPESGPKERRRKSDAKKTDREESSVEKRRTRLQKSTNVAWTRCEASKPRVSATDARIVDSQKTKHRELARTETDVKHAPSKPDNPNSGEGSQRLQQAPPNVLETSKTRIVLPHDAERRRGNCEMSHKPPSAARLRSASGDMWGTAALKLSPPRGVMEFYEQYEECGQSDDGRRHSMPPARSSHPPTHTLHSHPHPQTLRPLPRMYYARVAQLISQGSLSGAPDLLHRANTSIQPLRSGLRRTSLRDSARHTNHGPLQPALWTPSTNNLPDNRVLSLGNKFVPMQYRTQPSNLSLSSIRRMNTQVLDNMSDFTLKRLDTFIQRAPSHFSDFRLSNDGAVLTKSLTRDRLSDQLGDQILPERQQMARKTRAALH